jgi:hypothetical protein
MARPNLRQRARTQAHAEVAPQVHRARNQARGEHRSINSTVPALEAGLESAARSARRAHLTPHDLQLLLKSFANQQADVASSAALQNQAVDRGTAETITGLREQEGAQTRSILSQLQSAAEQARLARVERKEGNQEDLANTLKAAELEKELGLGDYAVSPLEEAEIAKYDREGRNGGLTPTQARAQAASQDAARKYAANLVRSVHEAHGVNSKGEQVYPAHPRDWSNSDWAELTEKVASDKGVNHYADAEHAVNAIRDHFQPGQTPPATPEQAGAKTVGRALGHAASSPLTAILQFGSSLAR